jgi:hypothetical protein
LEGLQKTHAGDRVWTEVAKSLMVKGVVEETLAPSNVIGKRLLRVRLDVVFVTIIPEENAQTLDNMWNDIEEALTNPQNVNSLALHEFSHLSISGLSNSEMIQDDDRYVHTRRYSFIVARR